MPADCKCQDMCICPRPGILVKEGDEMHRAQDDSLSPLQLKQIKECIYHVLGDRRSEDYDRDLYLEGYRQGFRDGKEDF